MDQEYYGAEEKAATENPRWVSEFVESLDQVATMLEKQTETLYKRLDPILGPDYPSEISAMHELAQTASEKPQRSNMANRLESIINRLDKIGKKNNRLLDRIEV